MATASPACAACRAPAAAYACAGCALVRYCGTDCQRGDWARHSAVCASASSAAITVPFKSIGGKTITVNVTLTMTMGELLKIVAAAAGIDDVGRTVIIFCGRPVPVNPDEAAYPAALLWTKEATVMHVVERRPM